MERKYTRDARPAPKLAGRFGVAAVALCSLMPCPARGSEGSGGLPLVCAVDAVVDGDTIAVTCSGAPIRVRLHCIDAPELDQVPWGSEARDHLAALTPRTLILLPEQTGRGERDRYGRLVATALAPDEARRDLGMAQVLAGQAATYPAYCADERYAWVEAVARRAGIGIWGLPGEHQTPWVWRHRR